MNKDVYPQSVDFNYSVRCSAHNLKPYVYCEMCMIRSELKQVKEDTLRSAHHLLASSARLVNDMHDSLENAVKKIHELQIEINLLKERVK